MSGNLVFPGTLAGDARRFGRWLTHQFTCGRHGERALPGLGAPPERVPADWTPLLSGSVDDVRRAHGRHARTQPRRMLTEQFIGRQEAPGRPPWEPVTGSFPALPGADAEADRLAYVRSQMRETVSRRDPQAIRQALQALRADAPVYGEVPVLAAGQAQRPAEGTIA